MKAWPAFALLGLVAAPLAAAEGAWEVEVARPGLVRVALPPDVPAGTGFEVRGPGGEEVAWRLVSLAGAQRRSARVTAVRAVTGGWELTVDTGPAPPRHQGLRLPLAETGAASLELMASDDGATWRPLAAATLFRLGGDAALQRSVLEYPAVDTRFLRLHWPAAAGFPALGEIELEVVAGPDLRLELGGASCTPAGARRTRCTVAAPGRPLRGIEVALPAGTAAGWRLREGVAGAWRLLGEGTWSAVATAAPRRLPLPTSGGPLLLELWGESAPPQAALTLLAEPLALELVAASAGTHRVSASPWLARQQPAAAAAGEAQWLQAVPSAATPVAAPPPAEGAPLPDVAFARAWPVTAAAAPGDPVRLELTAEVLAAASAGLGDLRLAAADRQVPYVSRTADAPASAASWTALAPAPRDDGNSFVEFPHPASFRTGELVLQTAPRALRRPARLRRLAPVGQGVAPPPSAAGPWTTWECRMLPPLPCEVTLTVPAGRGAVAIELADGDDAPLAALDAELWEPRRELWLRWPAAPVTLLAGAPDLRAPTYELAAFGDRLVGGPATTAVLGAASDPGGAFRRWPRWTLFAALGAVAATLLVVLGRALRTPAGDQPT